MLKKFQRIDALFNWIRRITLLIVAIYMVWCYSLIRKICQPSAPNKAAYSMTKDLRLTKAEPAILLQAGQ